jgi:amino-acid N-acetyltransferase
MTSRTWTVEKAGPADREGVESLLSASELPLDGLNHTELWCIRDGDSVIGAAGLETWGDQGLLRSVVVAGRYRGSGIGKMLTESVLEAASEKGLSEVYLLTETAPDFFERFGFTHFERKNVKGDVLNSVEFKDACPETAPVMRVKVPPRL